MRIAVCLSGQPRSIEFASKSITEYFKNTSEHQYDFFCHSWDYNTWKIRGSGDASPKEIIDRDWLSNQLSKFNPISTIINSEEDFFRVSNEKYIAYGSLTYSMMIANHLKSMHEYKHNFVYDYVYKARYDSIFEPNSHPIFPGRVEDRVIYFPHLGRILFEFNRLNSSDCVFFGDSWGMNITCDLYRHLYQRSSIVDREDDPDVIGPGTTAFTYATSRNVNHRQCGDYRIQEIFYRKEVLGLDPIIDFNTILATHASYYSPLP